MINLASESAYSASIVQTASRCGKVSWQSDPDPRALRTISVPGTRIEVAQFLVNHSIEIMEEFYETTVEIAVIGSNVVTA